MQQTVPVNDRTIATAVGSTPSTGPFTVDFPFFSLADVLVTQQNNGSEAIFVLVRGSDYTLVGVATEDGSFSSGTVTLINPVSNTVITRSGQTPIERLSSFPLQGFFSRLALNAELNRITMWMQEADSGLTGGGGGSASSGLVFVGAVPPQDPHLGTMWWNSSATPVSGGQLYIFYDDGSTQQWVPASPKVDSQIGMVSTVAMLPPLALAGSRAFVTDANATTFNAIVAGGGTNRLPVFSDGTNWRIG